MLPIKIFWLIYIKYYNYLYHISSLEKVGYAFNLEVEFDRTISDDLSFIYSQNLSQ